MLSLSQTSALVLVCDNVSYQSAKAKEFLSYLDLSAGHKMYQKIIHLKPHLDEVIPNRKYIIHNFIKSIIKKREAQIISLACGWDPILIKLNEEYPNNSFFGIDSESISLQQNLVNKITPHSRISYIHENINAVDALIDKLKQNNWSPDKLTCLVVEGISYYISPHVFWKSLKALRKAIHADCFICGDFLIDWNQEKVSALTKKIGSGIFEMIKETCRHNYYTYTKSYFIESLKKAGWNTAKIWSQDKIQKERTGKSDPWKNGEGHIYLFSAESI